MVCFEHTPTTPGANHAGPRVAFHALLETVLRGIAVRSARFGGVAGSAMTTRIDGRGWPPYTLGYRVVLVRREYYPCMFGAQITILPR